MEDNLLDIPAHLAGRTATSNVRRPTDRDEEKGLPSQAGDEYRAFGRPANKALFSIHFLSPSGAVRSFQYHHLDSDSRFENGIIKLRFALGTGLPPIEVSIEGRNLWEAYDLIHQHRMPWVAVASRDFAKDGQSIVTSIRIQEIQTDGV